VPGSASGLSILGTNKPNPSGYRCLNTCSSIAAKTSAIPLHQIRAGTRAKYVSGTEDVATVSEEERS
jgi:hypothetical protein